MPTEWSSVSESLSIWYDQWAWSREREEIVKQVLFLALGIGVQVITAPTFIGACVAKDDPGKCMLIRIGIVLAVWVVLNLLAGKKK